MKRNQTLDGQWAPDRSPDHHDYQYYRAGPIAVRFHEGFEPDGELVTREPVTVHIERMDRGYWSLILTAADGTEVHVNFYSQRRIGVSWRNET